MTEICFLLIRFILFWCNLKEYKKPTEVFGFETSQKEYTLAAFGAMADKFKENYFQKAVGVSIGTNLSAFPFG